VNAALPEVGLRSHRREPFSGTSFKHWSLCWRRFSRKHSPVYLGHYVHPATFRWSSTWYLQSQGHRDHRWWAPFAVGIHFSSKSDSSNINQPPFTCLRPTSFRVVRIVTYLQVTFFHTRHPFLKKRPRKERGIC